MPDSQLLALSFGHVGSRIVHAAVQLGVPDALAPRALAVPELAAALDCDPDGLSRLLRALVVLGLVDPVEGGLVALAKRGRPLCADHPRSLRPAVLLLGHPAVWQAWGQLPDAVRTGGAAFERAHGHPLFDHLAGDCDLAGSFDTAMHHGAETVADHVVRAYDVTGARSVVDIGGGRGALLARILQAAPSARGTLFDRAEVVPQAEAALRRAGLADRCTIEPGDFFQRVPPGDLLLLMGILHDWDDERCRTVLANCRRAIAPDGRLLVIEPVLPVAPVLSAGLADPTASQVVMSDIAMLVYTGGRERDRSGFEALLTDTGFALAEVSQPLPGSAARILVARPA